MPFMARTGCFSPSQLTAVNPVAAWRQLPSALVTHPSGSPHLTTVAFVDHWADGKLNALRDMCLRLRYGKSSYGYDA